MNLCGGDIRILAGNASKDLAVKIAKELGVSLADAFVKSFSDGESSVTINESVRGADVFVIQSTSSPVNENLMQLLLMIDALKRASAGRINAVIPYFGYARQDRKAKPRDPISAKLCANLIEAAGADRVVTMDLHAPQIQGFFDIPVDHLMGMPILYPYYKEKFKGKTDEFMVVSPDLGSVGRCRAFAEKLNVPLGIIDKRRPMANESEVMNIIGKVKGKRIIIIDDMIDTAGTLCNSAKAVIEIGGAKEVYACATHGVLSGDAMEKIEKSVMKEVLILDTITIPEAKKTSKFRSLSVAKLLAKGIENVHNNKSVSSIIL